MRKTVVSVKRKAADPVGLLIRRSLGESMVEMEEFERGTPQNGMGSSRAGSSSHSRPHQQYARMATRSSPSSGTLAESIPPRSGARRNQVGSSRSAGIATARMMQESPVVVTSGPTQLDIIREETIVDSDDSSLHHTVHSSEEEDDPIVGVRGNGIRGAHLFSVDTHESEGELEEYEAGGDEDREGEDADEYRDEGEAEKDRDEEDTDDDGGEGEAVGEGMVEQVAPSFNRPPPADWDNPRMIFEDVDVNEDSVGEMMEYLCEKKNGRSISSRQAKLMKQLFIMSCGVVMDEISTGKNNMRKSEFYAMATSVFKQHIDTAPAKEYLSRNVMKHFNNNWPQEYRQYWEGMYNKFPERDRNESFGKMIHDR